MAGYELEVDFYNSFWLKKTIKQGDTTPSWPGLPWNPTGYPTFAWATPTNPKTGDDNWYIEETKIKGGFNNTTAHIGVRAYTVDENINFDRKINSLIYSGVFNTRTEFNATNVFSISDGIVKDADPVNGSIQKLYTEDTNLLMFQENKVSRILVNKNTIYSGEQGSTEPKGDIPVLGQIVPFLGEYGISENPESFAVFGYRKYFADKNRAAILRLSRDGITEISSYGMRDYFRDYLATISNKWDVVELRYNIDPTNVGVPVSSVDVDSTTCCGLNIGAIISFNTISDTAIITNVVDAGAFCTVSFTPALTFPIAATRISAETYNKDKISAGFDIHNQNYTISMQTSPRYESTDATSYATVAFDDHINGWISFQSYKPLFIDSLKNKFYSFIDSSIYEHYYAGPSADNHGKFYGATTPTSSTVTFVFNPQPAVTKNFNTVAYEGSNGWKVESYTSDFEGFDREWSGGVITGTWDESQDITNSVLSYVEGAYDGAGNTGTAASPNNPPLLRAGFDRKENRYVANLISNSAAQPGEVIFGNAMSGIKGYVATVTVTTDGVTDVGGAKELFSVSSNYVASSY